MTALRTLRDFWEGVPRRAYAVAAAEDCVRNVQPSHAVIHCLVKKANGTSAAAMILHVRGPRRPSFEIVAPPQAAPVAADGEARKVPSGFWLDPASTGDGKRVPFTASSGDPVQQPAEFPHDAVLTVAF